MDDLVPSHGVRPSALLPLWKLAGFALGQFLTGQTLLCGLLSHWDIWHIAEMVYHYLLQTFATIIVFVADFLEKNLRLIYDNAHYYAIHIIASQFIDKPLNASASVVQSFNCRSTSRRSHLLSSFCSRLLRRISSWAALLKFLLLSCSICMVSVVAWILGGGLA